MNQLKLLLIIALSMCIQQGMCSSYCYHDYDKHQKTHDSLEMNRKVKRFNKKANVVLNKMETAAKEMSVEGVCLIAFIPQTVPETWVSQMKIIGPLRTKEANLLGIVYTKAAEMAETFKNSGSGTRPPLSGEYGYPGGLIRPYRSGYFIAAFSGGSDANDLAISKIGLDELEKGF